MDKVTRFSPCLKVENNGVEVIGLHLGKERGWRPSSRTDVGNTMTGGGRPPNLGTARSRKLKDGRGPSEMPSDAANGLCVLRSCSAVLDRGISGRHEAVQNDTLIRMVWDATVRSDTGQHPGAGLLIRRSQVRILPGAPQNPRSNRAREDLGRGPRGVFGACVLLVCSPVQGECRWGSTSRSTLPVRDPVGVPRALRTQGQPRHQPSHHTPELTTGEPPLPTCTISNDTVNTVASSFR